jgi:hypothetical protein
MTFRGRWVDAIADGYDAPINRHSSLLANSITNRND